MYLGIWNFFDQCETMYTFVLSRYIAENWEVMGHNDVFRDSNCEQKEEEEGVAFISFRFFQFSFRDEILRHGVSRVLYFLKRLFMRHLSMASRKQNFRKKKIESK